MRRVWKKFIRNHRGKFSAELKLKTYFSVRTGFYFAHPIYFCIDINGYLVISFPLKVSEAGAGKQFMRILCSREPPWSNISSKDV